MKYKPKKNNERKLKKYLKTNERDNQGKLLIHETSRPSDTTTYYTSRGDDITDVTKTGGGNTSTFISHVSGDPDPDPVYLDFNIAENITAIPNIVFIVFAVISLPLSLVYQ